MKAGWDRVHLPNLQMRFSSTSSETSINLQVGKVDPVPASLKDHDSQNIYLDHPLDCGLFFFQRPTTSSRTVGRDAGKRFARCRQMDHQGNANHRNPERKRSHPLNSSRSCAMESGEVATRRHAGEIGQQGSVASNRRCEESFDRSLRHWFQIGCEDLAIRLAAKRECRRLGSVPHDLSSRQV